jgi:sulfate/thiosulfate transport system ATP-binding protein
MATPELRKAGGADASTPGGADRSKAGGREAQQDSPWVRWPLTIAALAILTWLIVIPVVNVFYEALAKGPVEYWTTLAGDADTLAAIRLTLTVAPVAVALNVVFGIAAAWTIARFRFRGRAFLTSILDLPFAISPVVAGLIFVLLFGLQGLFGEWLRDHGIKILFSTPGLILATSFVTMPFVARELIPLMEAIGDEEETAAVSLGAGAWHMFRRVTLPNIKWGLLYGIILCNARAMGEFGAVYVVSGRITGQTDTLPLRVEKLFQEYNMHGSFVAASLLCFLAVGTLAIKTFLEWKTRRELAERNFVPDHDALGDSSSWVPALAPALAGAGVGIGGVSLAVGGIGASRSTPVVREKPRPLAYESVGTGGSAPAPDLDAPPSGVGISVRGISKTFGNFHALDNVNLDVPDGSLIALLGPSGSGKTTLLRIIAGLETADTGTVRYRDVDATHQSPGSRNVGFVFQHYALFRHMSVFENVAFGLRVRRSHRPGESAREREERIAERVRELLHLVQLGSYEKHAPSQLSGGQRQRVALARALAPDPKLLLLDEPFGALDARVRKELRSWLRKLHHEIGLTSVLVTHDQEEAFEVADRVVVMNRGRIEQEGSSTDVFDHPANAFVLDFLGNVNVFHGRVEGGRAFLGGLEVDYPEYPHDEARSAKAYVRPHELEIDRYEHSGTCVRASIQRVTFTGALVKVELFAEEFGVPLTVETTRDRWAHLHLGEGDNAFVFPKNLRLFVHDYQI